MVMVFLFTGFWGGRWASALTTPVLVLPSLGWYISLPSRGFVTRIGQSKYSFNSDIGLRISTPGNCAHDQCDDPWLVDEVYGESFGDGGCGPQVWL